MGAYHGRAGFETFSHLRTVVGSRLPASITQFTGPIVDVRLHEALRTGVDSYRRLLRMRLRH